MSKTKRQKILTTSSPALSQLKDSELLDRILADLAGILQLQEFQRRLVREVQDQIGILKQRRLDS
jgi:hypothetical protein